jgi:putative transcriptional regulator
MTSLRGHFLIASPELNDPNFRQAVVLMVQHGDDGALGLILNRPADTTIRQVWEKVSDEPCQRDQTLYVGGPCQGPLMAVHTADELSDEAVLPGVHFSAQPDNLVSLVGQAEGEIRFFIGFAGWSPGQLEAELEGGSWRVVPAKCEQVFAPPTDLWVLLMRQLTGSALVSMLRIKHVPGDLSNN